MDGVDFVLGGHDHSYVAEVCESTGVILVKSGTDFEEFSDIQVELGVSEQEALGKQKTAANSANIKVLYSKQK